MQPLISLVEQKRPDLSPAEQRALARRLSDRIFDLTNQLRRRNPPPADAEFQQRAAHLNSLAAMAREQVLTEALEGPDLGGPGEELTPYED